MLYGIEFVLQPWRDQHRLRAGFSISGQEAVLTRRTLLDANQYVLIALRLVDAQEETIVRLFIDEQVVGRVRADDMVLDALRALVVVPLDVVKRLRVGGPDEGPPGRRYRFLKFLAGLDLADADVVILRSEPVDAIGDERVVRTVIDGRDSKEVLAFAFEVAIVKNGFLPTIARRPNE